MQSLGQQYFEGAKSQGKFEGWIEAWIEGWIEGWVKGMTEGEAKVLVWLLEKRIGPVSEALRTRIFAADLTSIESWIHRAMDATEFESVFGHVSSREALRGKRPRAT